MSITPSVSIKRVKNELFSVLFYHLDIVFFVKGTNFAIFSEKGNGSRVEQRKEKAPERKVRKERSEWQKKPKEQRKNPRMKMLDLVPLLFLELFRIFICLEIRMTCYFMEMTKNRTPMKNQGKYVLNFEIFYVLYFESIFVFKAL